jgi:hypothetical protein
MSWRIRAVGIYSHTGHLREVPLEPQGLSVVTGAPAKGKSTLLDIIDYCLLSRTCPIAKGVVRSRVASVAVLLESNGYRLAIARKLPLGSQGASPAVAMEFGQELPLWPSEPEFGWSTEMAKEEIASFTRIEAIPVLRNYDDPSKGHSVGIRQCIPYLFQPQDVIASRNVTFPRLEDTWQRNHAIDALPYFLGLVSGQQVQDRQRVRQLQVERNRIARDLEAAISAEANATEQLYDLYSEAISFGLVERRDVTKASEIHKELRSVIATARQTSDENARAEEPDPEDALAEARREENRVRVLVSESRARLAEVRKALHGVTDYEAVREKQLGRLRIGELLPKGAQVGACPLCGNGTLDVDGLQANLALAEKDLANLAGSGERRLISRLERERDHQQEEEVRLEALLRRAQRAVVIAQGATQERRDRQTYERKRWQLIGRIVALETQRSTPTNPFKEKLASLDAELAQLRRRSGTNALSELLERTQEDIQNRMTDLASELGVEFPNSPCRLNLSELRIEVAFDDKFSPLSELGSGANWVGYHIAATLALHEYFRRADSSMPQVLVLDQPSQAWFPQLRGTSKQPTVPANDTDAIAVRNLFRVLDTFAKGPHGPQIIAIDHAYFEEEWFRAATQQNWHDAEGLVPADWPSA